jgi:hypothetical protein
VASEEDLHEYLLRSLGPLWVSERWEAHCNRELLTGKRKNGFAALLAPVEDAVLVVRSMWRHLNIEDEETRRLKAVGDIEATPTHPAVAVLTAPISRLGDLKRGKPVPEWLQADWSDRFGLVLEDKVVVSYPVVAVASIAKPAADAAAKFLRIPCIEDLHVILHVQRNEKGTLELAVPGGKRDLGESGVDCAKRECHEEVAVNDAALVTWLDPLHPSDSPNILVLPGVVAIRR